MNPQAHPLLKLTRRHFFRDCGVGVGKIALASLLAESMPRMLVSASTSTSGLTMMPRPAQFPGKAKAVIHLFMAGAPSHLDLFDPQAGTGQVRRQAYPAVDHWRTAIRLHPIRCRGARPAIQIRQAWPKRRRTGRDAAAPGRAWPMRSALSARFIPISSTTPRPRFFSTPASPSRAGPASDRGSPMAWARRPSDLPAFVVMSTGNGISGGAANWSSGFLPILVCRHALPQRGRPDP